MVPTVEEVIKCYCRVAIVERAKTGRPGEKTVANVSRGAQRVCEAAGVSLAESVDNLTADRLEGALENLMRRGLSRISIRCYFDQLHALFATWCRPYYRRAGWDVPQLDIPVFRAQPPRYVRPSSDQLRRVKDWYRGLTDERWFAATMMLEFAMRNGDVLRLKDENFVERKVEKTGGGGDGAVLHFLSYTPHKTELSSGRRVFWPIHKSVWQMFVNYGGLAGLDVTEETFRDLNRELRGLSFHGPKASYELRKICIDHVYQKFGAEVAVALSGDDIKTISRYYADPAEATVGPVRVVDLL